VLFLEALTHSQTGKDPSITARVYHNLAALAYKMGDEQGARDYYSQAVRLKAMLGLALDE
jgi:hypothetical protein